MSDSKKILCRAFALMLTVVMTLTTVPMVAFANADNTSPPKNSTSITGSTSLVPDLNTTRVFDVSEGRIQILDNGDDIKLIQTLYQDGNPKKIHDIGSNEWIKITGNSSNYLDNIEVNTAAAVNFSGVTANVILDNLTIDVSNKGNDNNGVSAIRIDPTEGRNSHVNMVITGSNSLRSTNNRAAIHISNEQKLIIDSLHDGAMLAAYGTEASSAIGGSYNEDCGTVIVLGGWLKLDTENPYSSGIGPSLGCSEANIEIRGNYTRVETNQRIGPNGGSANSSLVIADGATVNFRGNHDLFDNSSTKLGECIINTDGMNSTEAAEKEGYYNKLLPSADVTLTYEKKEYWDTNIVKEHTLVTAALKEPLSPDEDFRWRSSNLEVELDGNAATISFLAPSFHMWGDISRVYIEKSSKTNSVTGINPNDNTLHEPTSSKPADSEQTSINLNVSPLTATVDIQNMPTYAKKNTGDIQIPVTLSNLSQEIGFEAKITLLKDGVVERSELVTENTPGTILSSSTNGKTVTLSGVVSIPTSMTGNDTASETYSLIVSGKNKGEATANTLTKNVTVVDPDLRHLTAVYYGNKFDDRVVSTGETIEGGVMLADVRNYTNASRYNSAPAYDYIMEHGFSNDRIKFEAPDAWGGVSYKIDNGPYSAYMSASLFSLAHEENTQSTITFKWQNSESEFKISYINESFSGNVYLFTLDEGANPAIFRWDGNEKEVTPNADGVYVLYSDNMISEVEISIPGSPIKIAIVDFPKSISSRTGPNISDGAQIIGDAARIAPTLPSNSVRLVENPSLRLYLVGQNGEAIPGVVTVSYIAVDNNFKPVVGDDALKGSGSTTNMLDYIKIPYTTLMKDRTRTILAEISLDGVSLMLRPIGLSELKTFGAEGKSTDIDLKVVAPSSNGQMAPSHYMLLEDEAGSRTVLGNSSEPLTFFAGEEARCTVFIDMEELNNQTTGLTLRTGTSATLAAGEVKQIGNSAGFQETYAMIPIDLEEKFAIGEEQNDITLYKDDNPIASLPSLTASSSDAAVIDDLREIITADFAKEMLDSLNIMDTIKDIAAVNFGQGFKTFSFDTPLIKNYFSFHVEKNDDGYFIVKGILNLSALPVPEHATEGEFLEMFTNFYNEYQSNLNNSTRLDPYYNSRYGASAFVGFRVFISGRAKYVDGVNGRSLQFEFNDAGGIAELSGKMTNSITYYGPMGLSIKGSYTVDGMLKGILSTEYPTKEYLDTKVGKVESGYPPIDFSMESIAHAGISTQLGAGPDIWIASLYVGIQGGASFDWRVRVLSRPYLENSDIDHIKAGSMTEAKANIGLFATKQFLFFVDTTRWDFAKWNYKIYSPDDSTNPYKQSTNQVVSSEIAPIGNVYTPIRNSRSNVLINNLDASAAAQYVGDMVIYKDIADIDDYNDDRIKIRSAGGSPTDLCDSAAGTEYALSAASGASKGIVGWEKLQNNYEIEDITNKTYGEIEDILEQVLKNFGVKAGYYDGSNWHIANQVDNATMEINPCAAYSEDENKGVIVWTQGKPNVIIVPDDSDKIASIEAELDEAKLVYTYFDGTNFSGELTAFEISDDETSISYSPAIDKDGNIVIVVVYEGGRSELVIIKPGQSPQRYPGFSREGAAFTDVIWDGTQFLYSYIDMGTEDNPGTRDLMIYKLDTDTGELKNLLVSGLRGDIGTDYQLVRDPDVSGLASIGVVWGGVVVADNEEYFSKQLHCARLFDDTATGTAMFTQAQPFGATTNEGEAFVSFDAKLSGNNMSVLAVRANENAGAVVSEENYTFTNQVVSAVKTFNAINMRPGVETDVELIVWNEGIVPIEALKTTIGDSVTELSNCRILPGEGAIVVAKYYADINQPLPVDLWYSTEATFSDNSSSTDTGTMNVYQVDVGISKINFQTGKDGVIAVVNVHNPSDLVLDNNSQVMVGIYADYGGHTKVTDPKLLSGNDIMAGGSTLTFNLNPSSIPNGATSLYAIVSTIDENNNPVRDVKMENNVLTLDINLVFPTSVRLDYTSLALKLGESRRLTANVLPDSASNKDVIWVSSDPSVALVSSYGTVTALSIGSSVITAKCAANSTAIATCTVIVTAGNTDRPGGGSGSLGSNLYEITIADVKTPYTLDQNGIAILEPTEAQVKNIVKGIGNAEIIIDFSHISSVSGVELKVDPAWLLDSGDVIIRMQDNFSLSICNGMMRELASKYGGTIVFSIHKGSLVVSIKQDGKELDWYSYKYPMTIGLPFDKGNEYTIIHDTERNAIIARSWYSNGVAYGNVYRSGKFDTKAAVPAGFIDTNGNWMDTAVRYMAARDVVHGVGGGQFLPGRDVTRGEFLTMLMQALNPEPQGEFMVQQFSDVPESAYYYDAVLKAKALGIVTGIGDNMFNPNVTISRQDMFTMLSNAMDKMNMYPAVMTHQRVEFTDWNYTAAYAMNPIQRLAQLGMVSGKGGGQLDPNGRATRGEAAQIVYSLLIRSTK